MSLYYHRDGTPADELSDIVSEFRLGANQIREDQIGDVNAFTVYLGINYRHGDGPPLIFGTHVDGGGYDEVYRYSTEAEAVAGHVRIVAQLRNGEELS